MKIECVMICVDFGDYLAHTIPYNKYVYDKMVVVTSEKDKKTSRVCEYFHVQCIKTNLFNTEFNKGKAINLGLQYLSREGWIVHQDADIVLPPRTRDLLEIARLREDTLYGIHRAMCPSYEAWARFAADPFVFHECDVYIHNNGPFHLGTQIGKLTKSPDDPADLGWIPCGYWQCWHEGGKNKKTYPEEFKNFASSDMTFAYQWPREKRSIIPEITCVHLSTPDQEKMGTNWDGRRTQEFGPIL